MKRDHITTSKEIQQQTGVTFHVATRFFPARVRHPTYVLYAFFRLADEIVDDVDPDPPATQQAELTRLREAALGERDADDPVLTAVEELRRRHEIPDKEIEEFVWAMEQDIDWRRATHDEQSGACDADSVTCEFENDEDLWAYLRGSAVAVAYMMLAVMDPDDPETARSHARALGEAFQLTNFIRDVREDAQDYGRIYLPRSTLDQYEVSVAELAAGQCTEGVRKAIETELRRTERRYREGVAGIDQLPKDCQFPVLLATVYYADYHRLIRQRNYDVLSSRPTLSRSRYLILAARTWYQWRRTGDPEQVFYRVSAIKRQEINDPETAAATVSNRIRSAGRAVQQTVFHMWGR